jgi:hypothetical protein
MFFFTWYFLKSILYSVLAFHILDKCPTLTYKTNDIPLLYFPLFLITSLFLNTNKMSLTQYVVSPSSCNKYKSTVYKCTGMIRTGLYLFYVLCSSLIKLQSDRDIAPPSWGANKNLRKGFSYCVLLRHRAASNYHHTMRSTSCGVT